MNVLYFLKKMQSISYNQKIVNFIKNFNETYTILSRLDIERNKSNDLISQKYLNIFYYMPDIYTCLGPKSYPFYTNFYIKIVNDF